MGKRDQFQLVPEDDPKFAKFWAHYPKRVAKKDARKAWLDLNPTEAMVDRMLTTLAWQSQQPAWLKDGGAFIPYPASWLRAERWTDEPIGIPAMTGRTSRTLAAAAEMFREGDR